MAAVGKPVVVTVKVPWLPTVKVVLAPEVMAAGWSTVRVKVCVACRADAVVGLDA